MRGREKFAKYKKVILMMVAFWKVLPYRFRLRLFGYFRNKNGNFGLVYRYTLLKSLAKCVGDNVSIFPGCYILEPQNLSIGNNVSIQPMCYIDATGGITIGDSVSIAHGSTIMSTDHSIEITDCDMKDQPIVKGHVIIESNSWIAAHCTVLQGSHIPYGSVIAAGAVVTRKLSMTSSCVWGGVPARLLKNR